MTLVKKYNYLINSILFIKLKLSFNFLFQKIVLK
ncbi:MAG: hypothetical protein JWR23_3112 [Mucilaginibacter sp.]|nr:hypothetical protein [Mucilaginibacter sp.]